MLTEQTGTFCSLICSLFACLFVLADLPRAVLSLQCFRPARRWTSTATTANASAAPGCVTATTTARTTQMNRTVVSVPLFHYSTTVTIILADQHDLFMQTDVMQC